MDPDITCLLATFLIRMALVSFLLLYFPPVFDALLCVILISIQLLLAVTFGHHILLIVCQDRLHFLSHLLDSASERAIIWPPLLFKNSLPSMSASFHARRVFSLYSAETSSKIFLISAGKLFHCLCSGQHRKPDRSYFPRGRDVPYHFTVPETLQRFQGDVGAIDNAPSQAFVHVRRFKRYRCCTEGLQNVPSRAIPLSSGPSGRRGCAQVFCGKHDKRADAMKE